MLFTNNIASMINQYTFILKSVPGAELLVMIKIKIVKIDYTSFSQ